MMTEMHINLIWEGVEEALDTLEKLGKAAEQAAARSDTLTKAIKEFRAENDKLRAICTELAEKGGRDG